VRGERYDLEPIIWLARHAYLTELEVQYIRDQARQSAPRVAQIASK
jgi:hypothetical protein